MKIEKIKLNNFRNYTNLELDFNPTKNLIIGKNGEGKTNIVEAIYVLAFSKSFRGSHEDVIVKNGETATRIEGVVKDKRKTSYKVIINELPFIELVKYFPKLLTGSESKSTTSD